MASPLPTTPRRAETTNRCGSSSPSPASKESARGLSNRLEIRRSLLQPATFRRRFRSPPSTSGLVDPFHGITVSTRTSRASHPSPSLSVFDPSTVTTIFARRPHRRRPSDDPLDSAPPPSPSPRGAAPPTPTPPPRLALSRRIDLRFDLSPSFSARALPLGVFSCSVTFSKHKAISSLVVISLVT
jgi:hypothetical protein